MLRTGRRCTWEDIEAGEVFANGGCWEIFCKTNDFNAIGLATDWVDEFHIGVDRCYFGYYSELYKLPKSVQALWKEE